MFNPEHKYFYFNTPMDIQEYIKIDLLIVLADLLDQYNSYNKVVPDGYLYIEIRKGMYCLPQGGILAHNQQVKYLGKYGQYLLNCTSGLSEHKHTTLFFVLSSIIFESSLWNRTMLNIQFRHFLHPTPSALIRKEDLLVDSNLIDIIKIDCQIYQCLTTSPQN